MALVHTPKTEKEFSLPSFSLKGTDGKIHSDQEVRNAKAALVMFICNHCPYVKAIEDRLIQLGSTLAQMKVPVLAISSNDADAYPEDSFEQLQIRAREKNYSFPYLYDESQDVARAFGAVCTPDFFVFDAKGMLAYRGRLDDSWKDPKNVTKQELLNAVKALVENKPITDPEVPSMGCSMKWKKS